RPRDVSRRLRGGFGLARDEATEAAGDCRHDEGDDGGGAGRHDDQAALPECRVVGEEGDEGSVADANRIDRNRHEKGHAGPGREGHDAPLMNRNVSLHNETSRFVQVFSFGSGSTILHPWTRPKTTPQTTPTTKPPAA